MKNILIMGIGRAGKTTLSEMIKSKFPNYNLLHSDCIKWGIIRAKGKEEYYRNHVEEQKEWEHSKEFQKILLQIFNSCIEDDVLHSGYILESGQLEPKQVKEMIDFEKTIVICLGHGSLLQKDIIALCRKNDTPQDWSYKETDKNLEEHAKKWSEMNQLLKKECPQYGIQYIDTSKDRKKTLKSILEEIMLKIEEK